MHWIALSLPWCDEASAPPAGVVHTAAAGWWALRFTPRVALVDAEAVLLEVSTTERLWGGREVLLAQVLQAWAWAGASARCSGPPVPRSLASVGLQGKGRRRAHSRRAHP